MKLTHGRHCLCSACAREDWTNPDLACCGMHGADCPALYQPLGRAGDRIGPVYCHCWPVFLCEPATAEVQDQNGVWIPVCERCMQGAWEAGLRVRKLQVATAV